MISESRWPQTDFTVCVLTPTLPSGTLNPEIAMNQKLARGNWIRAYFSSSWSATINAGVFLLMVICFKMTDGQLKLALLLFLAIVVANAIGRLSSLRRSP